MTQEASSPPKLQESIKKLWLWLSIAFTVFGFLGNAFKVDQWLPTDLQNKGIGTGIVVICFGVAVITIAWHVFVRLRFAVAGFSQKIEHIATDVTQLQSALSAGASSSESKDSEHKLYVLFQHLHRINEAYRSNLIGHWGERFEDEQIRQPLLHAVCGELAEMFVAIWSVDHPIVTVKRTISIDGDGSADTVYTFARSKACPARDGEGEIKYKISRNTAFSTASRKALNGRYYYHCNDLEAEEKANRYSNERPEWKNHYLSTLVVPIQGPAKRPELVGFLTVDSARKGAFNDTSHLYLMAALADQMYNYFALSDELSRLAAGPSKKPKRT